MAPPPSCVTAAWTSWPATFSAEPSTRQCSTSQRTAATSPGSIFSTPAPADYYPDYDGALAVAVALLRTEAGRTPHDPDLTELIGELATRSEAFRTRWSTHDVRLHRRRRQDLSTTPPSVTMELAYDSMELVGAPGLVLTAYTAEPATASADNLALLATWAATEADAQPAPTATRSPDTAQPNRVDRHSDVGPRPRQSIQVLCLATHHPRRARKRHEH